MIYVKQSNIHGVGLFAEKNFSIGEKVKIIFGEDASTKKYLPTKCSFYVNHSNNKNCDIVLENKIIYMVANKNIQQGEELTSNYRDLLNLPIDLTHLNIDYDLE
jgi:SET domain-containing protein